MRMQTTLAILIVALAAAYALRRIWQAFRRSSSNPCDGCSGCPLKAQNIKNKTCPEKKF